VESLLNLTKVSHAEAISQRNGLQERCDSLRLHMEQVETELVELRTEKEMWSLEGGEYHEMVEILQTKNEELRQQMAQQSNEEERKAQATVKRFEGQLAQMKSAYDKVLSCVCPLLCSLCCRRWKS
jgi:chromosome segregation ATPase